VSTFYLISTPIGNLGDITFRAAKALWSVDVLLCEDTRHTGKLLEKYREYQVGPKPKLLAYTDFNRGKRIPQVVALLKEGKDIGLVSNAGTPLISDPGYKLVREVIKLAETNPDVGLTVLPGANAVLPAVLLSGLPPDRFYFAGFLPRKSFQRRKFLSDLPRTTIIAYESPRRLVRSLGDIKEVLGDIPVAICQEMTKLYESVFRSTIGEAIQDFSKRDKIRGEIVLVLDNR